jgi:hypothetical protein
VLRFAGRVPKRCKAELKSTCRTRAEGVCLKHWIESNSIKMYDRGSVLRVETTINEPGDFRVLRPPANDPHAAPDWRVLRRTTADLPRRAEVSHQATERCLEAMSVVEGETPLGVATARLTRRVKSHRQWHRALPPFAQPDLQLLAVVNDLKFTVTGLTNADVRQALYAPRKTKRQTQKDASRVTRLLRLLRAHRLLRKIPKSHRYHVTPDLGIDLHAAEAVHERLFQCGDFRWISRIDHALGQLAEFFGRQLRHCFGGSGGHPGALPAAAP